MTTKEAAQVLGKSNAWLYKMARKAKLRKSLYPGGDTNWNDEDVQRMRVLLDYGVEDDWQFADQYTVIYCRTEAVDDLPPAAGRLEAQKRRMIQYATGRALNPDIILGEVRPVLRYGVMSVHSASPTKPTALQSLFGLIFQRKVRVLVIETIDRLCVADAWLLYEQMLRAMGVEVVVANRVWPTDEQAKEAKSWMADLLTRYKVMSGEVHDQRTIDVLMKGYDPKATFLAATKIEAKLTAREKQKKKPNWAKLPPEKRILDLDDCWTP